MYHVKLYNKISKVGLDDLDPAKYAYGEEMAEYDAVLVRSAKLHDVQFPEGLKCIARAGAGMCAHWVSGLSGPWTASFLVHGCFLLISFLFHVHGSVFILFG